MNFRSLLPSILVASALVMSCGSSQARPRSSAVPRDFYLRASFTPGTLAMDPGVAWRLRVAANGRSIQSVYRFPKGTWRDRAIFISASELKRLGVAIDRSRFFSLPAEMSGDASHSPGYTLEISASGRSHKVHVYAPYVVRDKQALARFWRVWAAVCRALPAPDRGEGLEHLRRNL